MIQINKGTIKIEGSMGTLLMEATAILDAVASAISKKVMRKI